MSCCRMFILGYESLPSVRSYRRSRPGQIALGRLGSGKDGSVRCRIGKSYTTFSALRGVDKGWDSISYLISRR